MRYTTYRYNIHTCQYERVKVRATNVVWYLLGLVVTGCCMLVGILLLHDLLVNTPNEKRLRKENRALRQHHASLSTHLNDLQPVLTSLQNKDRLLHTRFFGSQPVLEQKEPDGASKEKLLLADGDSFRHHIISIRQASQRLIERSIATRNFFSRKLHLSKSDLEEIDALLGAGRGGSQGDAGESGETGTEPGTERCHFIHCLNPPV